VRAFFPSVCYTIEERTFFPSFGLGFCLERSFVVGLLWNMLLFCFRSAWNMDFAKIAFLDHVQLSLTMDGSEDGSFCCLWDCHGNGD
jgi:hypothetical protein